ncbi:hypothetical protein ACOSQ2_007124 [Xanthoceras sorbifolium]
MTKVYQSITPVRSTAALFAEVKHVNTELIKTAIDNWSENFYEQQELPAKQDSTKSESQEAVAELALPGDKGDDQENLELNADGTRYEWDDLGNYGK